MIKQKQLLFTLSFFLFVISSYGQTKPNTASIFPGATTKNGTPQITSALVNQVCKNDYMFVKAKGVTNRDGTQGSSIRTLRSHSTITASDIASMKNGRSS